LGEKAQQGKYQEEAADFHGWFQKERKLKLPA
jgi:hypothetical protein